MLCSQLYSFAKFIDQEGNRNVLEYIFPASSDLISAETKNKVKQSTFVLTYIHKV